MFLSPMRLCARVTSVVCLATVAAAAKSIAAVRAWATLDVTGMVRVSDMVSRPRRSAEAATSTKKGTYCLLPLLPVTSGTMKRLLLSVQELELLVP